MIQHVQMMKLVSPFSRCDFCLHHNVYFAEHCKWASGVGPHNKPIGARQFENLEHDGREFGSFKQTIIFLFASNSVLRDKFAGNGLEMRVRGESWSDSNDSPFGNIFPCDMKTNDCGRYICQLLK